MFQLAAKNTFRKVSHYMEENCDNMGRFKFNPFWKLWSAMTRVFKKYIYVFYAVLLTITWTQMYPCVFGLSDVIEIEPLIQGNADLLPSRVGNTTIKTLDPSGELINGPATFILGFLLFLVTLFHCPPSAGKTFSVISGLATIICATAQGISLYMGNSLQVLPVISWLPTVYFRVNFAQILLIFAIFGPRLFGGCFPAVEEEEEYDDECSEDCTCEPSSAPARASATTPGKRPRKTTRGKVITICHVAVPPMTTLGASVPSNFASKTDTYYDMEKGGKDIGKTGTETDENDNEIGKNKGNATAIKAAIARLLIMFHLQPKDYTVKIQTVESKYGTNHYVGFPDYPPVVKPNGCPNSFPSPGSGE